MATLHQFTYGFVTLALSYGLSVLGSFMGLVAAARAQAAMEHRVRWLVLASWAIGGTGIWVMHFMAMIGFSVVGSEVRYDIATTVASWLIAVVMVGIGLFIVGYGRPSVAKVLLGGPLAGLGVAAMHYTGMGAMRVGGDVHYDQTLVIVSVAIAVIAATAALAFTVLVRKPRTVMISALIMGIAVSGMHYTGMYALRIHLATQAPGVSGVQPIVFLLPIMVFVILVLMALCYALLVHPVTSDSEIAAQMRARLTRRPAGDGPGYPPHL
ncbi:MAG: signal protein [Micromonosporaceae bacterium]|nr:signal protein [Micromonosporaceae bacterium]